MMLFIDIDISTRKSKRERKRKRIRTRQRYIEDKRETEKERDDGSRPSLPYRHPQPFSKPLMYVIDLLCDALALWAPDRLQQRRG